MCYKLKFHDCVMFILHCVIISNFMRRDLGWELSLGEFKALYNSTGSWLDHSYGPTLGRCFVMSSNSTSNLVISYYI